jgi:hypothetical protein
MSDLPQQRLWELFIYQPDTGSLIWRARPREEFKTANSHAVWNSKYADRAAGWVAVNGYRYVNCEGRTRKVSRLVWTYHKGTTPDRIDHEDGDIANDRIGNLRDVSQGENSKNRARGKNNRSGVLGVYPQGAKWAAQINIDGHKKYLGTYPSVGEARAARKAAEAAYGYHCNHGREAAA